MCPGSDLIMLTVSWLVTLLCTGWVQLVVSVVAGIIDADCGKGGSVPGVSSSVVSRSAGQSWPVPVVSSLVMS